MSIKRTIGDFNHKYPYRALNWAVSSLTDAVPFALSDMFLFVYRYTAIAYPILVLIGTYLLVRVFTKADSDVNLDTVLIQLAVLLVIGVVYVFVMAQANYWRTPYWEKMGLTKRDFDIDEEIAFVIRQLNQMTPPTDRKSARLYAKIGAAIQNYTQVYDGYPMRATSRIKRSIFAPEIALRLGDKSMYMWIFAEILWLGETLPDTIGHEMVHSYGHFDEAQTTFNSIVPLSTDQDPEVRFWGFFGWLITLLEYYSLVHNVSEDWSRHDYARQMGLREDVVAVLKLDESAGVEMKARIKKRTDVLDSDASLGRKLVSLGLLFVFLLPILFVYVLREIALKFTGQQSTKHAYYKLPLGYLAAYRRKFVNDFE